MKTLIMKKQPGGIVFANDNNFHETLKSFGSQLVLINFLHGGKDFEKHLNLLLRAQQDHHYRLSAVIVNKNEAVRISREFNIIGTPTIVLMKNGKEFNRILGTIEDLELSEILEEIVDMETTE